MTDEDFFDKNPEASAEKVTKSDLLKNSETVIMKKLINLDDMSVEYNDKKFLLRAEQNKQFSRSKKWLKWIMPLSRSENSESEFAVCAVSHLSRRKQIMIVKLDET